ncbi:MAG TPA: T9SS type A sorting domain-containing protein [Bacteroidota bacterium]|nr:T9SS type A sorting domain-containing protein [Bacteroidota bacterium]
MLNEVLVGGVLHKTVRTVVHVGQNVRIYPSSITQTETFITRHPTSTTILFASANTIDLNSGFVSEGIYVSTNSGLNWYGSDTCKGLPITFHRGDPGIAIDANGNFILIRLGFSPGLYSHYSTDNGITWSSQKTIVTNDQDRASLVSDHIPSSKYYGRSYAVWVRYSPPFPLFISYTDDGARTWSSPKQINTPTQRGQGGEVAIGPNGIVYSCWAGVIDLSPFTEDFVGFASSTNGGTDWTIQENAFDINGIAGIFSGKSNIRTNGLPRIDVDKSGGVYNGWIYIVTTQKNLSPAGSDPDIILHRSTNGGVTWSAGIRVNQDTVNNGKFQYFPTIHVDDKGGVNILYYDDRNTTSDSAAVYLSRSTDGGTTWIDVQVSDHTFKPQPIGGLGQGYQGDNIGMTSVDNTLWPVWMDNSTGSYQIWTCPIELSTLSVKDDEPPIPSQIELKQNYPNPFNPITNISFTIRQSSFIDLKVFDLSGKEVERLIHETKQPDEYSIVWDATGYASGVYLYQLTVGKRTYVRKMLVIQ